MGKTSGNVRNNPHMSISAGRKIYDDTIRMNRASFEAQARKASTEKLEKFAKMYNAKNVETSFIKALYSNVEVNQTFHDYTRNKIENAAANHLRREILNAELKRRRK